MKRPRSPRPPHPPSRVPHQARLWACLAAITLIMTLSEAGRLEAAENPSARRKIPVILDTDIGDDIDDTWALGLLLQSPELDLKLVVGDHGKNLYRARLLAKLLEKAGRTDVPVGIGLDVNVQGEGPQAAWVKDYDLNQYRGRVYPDGVRALIHVILESRQPVTLIAIGPVPNLAAALALEPRIAAKARLVGMHGSVRLGYNGSKEIHAEYNVKCDAKACQRALTAAWPITLTPLDTCGLVSLGGAQYQRVFTAPNPVARAILENYQLWSVHQDKTNGQRTYETRSSILFDTVAVYLAIEETLTTIEELPLRVTDDGFTRIDPAGTRMRVATSWKNREAFEEFLARRLAPDSPAPKP